MPWKLTLSLALLLGVMNLSGCVAAAVGAGGAIVVDSALENERGGDGLF